MFYIFESQECSDLVRTIYESVIQYLKLKNANKFSAFIETSL